MTTITYQPAYGALAGNPSTTSEWLDRARQVAQMVAGDAAQRESEGEPPYREVQLLKDSGLVTLLGPADHGGAAERWTTALRASREVSRADGSLGQLLGYHYLWAWATRFFGTDEQIAAAEAHYTRNCYFYSGAINPRDKDIVATDEGDTLRLNGSKSFASGSLVSDLTCLTGKLEDDRLVFIIVDSSSPQLVYNHDWDNMGQRGTDSQTITYHDVFVADGWHYAAHPPSPILFGAVMILHAALMQGIGDGALDAITHYVRTLTRGTLPQFATAAEDPLILRRIGEISSRLAASRALLFATADHIEQSSDQSDVAAITVDGFRAKVACVEASLEAAATVHEITGARATSSKFGLDRFWRNARTFASHDPTDAKNVYVGSYEVTGELPPITSFIRV